jgi:NADH dehydrogenase
MTNPHASTAVPGIQKLSGKRVFVTGATCPLGVEICRILRGNVEGIVALVKDSEKAERYLDDADILEGRCEMVKSYRERLHECPIVIHVAGMRFASFIVRACAGHPSLARILFISSVRVHYPPELLTPVERRTMSTLEEEEKAVMTSRLPWTVLRPTLIFSPRDRSISRIVGYLSSKRVFPMPGRGNAEKQPISARDLALSVVKTLGRPETLQRSYDTPGKSVRVDEMIRVISREMNCHNHFLSVPRLSVRLLRRCAQVLGNRKYAAALQQYLRWYDSVLFSGEDAARDFAHAPHEFAQSFREQFQGDIA